MNKSYTTWTEVQWRQNSFPSEGFKSTDWRNSFPSITSFYVSNPPGDVTKKEIWKLCLLLGKLVDVYINGRRDAFGAFFVFVRFSEVTDPSTIEKNLNEIICSGRKLKANCAKHPHDGVKSNPIRNTFVAPTSLNHATRDSRSFVDVAIVKKKNDGVLTISLSSIHKV